MPLHVRLHVCVFVSAVRARVCVFVFVSVSVRTCVRVLTFVCWCVPVCVEGLCMFLHACVSSLNYHVQEKEGSKEDTDDSGSQDEVRVGCVSVCV
ncbi:MAG: hypothetical protein P4L40_08015 [Terracidiphilus sp.]|nr:hypothetical protein [Terracidiphilus sp.]